MDNPGHYIDREELVDLGPRLIEAFRGDEESVTVPAAFLFFALVLSPVTAAPGGMCNADPGVIGNLSGVRIKDVEQYLEELVEAGLLEPIPGCSAFLFCRRPWMGGDQRLQ